MPIGGLPSGFHNHSAESKLKLLEVATSAPKADVLSAKQSKSLSTDMAEISHQDQVHISKLKAIDEKVRMHEQAHLTAGHGIDVSHASFTYQRGPDGVNYAVGGEVRIDTSPGNTPQEKLSRAEKIIDVALAPSDPSAIDRSVAAKAQYMAQEARMEITQENGASKAADPQSSVAQAYDSKVPGKKHIDTFV